MTISVSNLPPATESGAREAFLERVDRVRGGQPEHPRRALRVRVGRRHVRRPTWPAARCPPCSRWPFTDTLGSSSAARWPTSPPRFEALPYAADFNPNVLERRPGRRRQHLRRPDRRLRHRPALQPPAVRGGRPRPRRAADHVGRGARRRQGDRRRHRTGRLRPDDPEQHRRLDAHLAERRLRRPPADAQRRRQHRRHDRQPGHDQGARVPAVAALGRQLDGFQLPARLGHDQPGVRRGPGRHVHERVRRLQQPRHRERDRSGLLRV